MALHIEQRPFRFKIFDIKTNMTTTITPPDEFVNLIWEFFSHGNNKGYSEHIAKVYYEKQGYTVEERYKSKDYRWWYPDLFVYNDIERFWVECKLYPDKVSMEQVEVLVEEKGKIFYVIPYEGDF